MSTTVELPGGSAVILDKIELTPRKQLPLKRLFLRSGDLMVKLAAARTVTSPDGEVEENDTLTGEDLVLNAHEAEILSLIQYATTWAYLKSWTLDLPFPKSPDDMLDLPSHVNDALDSALTAIHGTKTAAEQFEPSEETLEDESSFTGNSEGSAAS
jgi:hypothetical protein